MEILQNLQKSLEIETEELNDLTEEFERIQDNLVSLGVVLDEQSKIGFYSHMVSFIRRIKNDESIMEITDISSQLEEESIEIAKSIVNPIYERNEKQVDLSEVLLVAIHIQAAKSK